MGIQVAVVGAAGFAGIELVRTILGHPSFTLVAATSNELAGVPVAHEYPGFVGSTNLAFTSHDDPAVASADVVFLAVPHTAALAMAPAHVARGAAVVDLSADFRLKDPAVYEQWYKVPHTAPDLLERAAFGLPELFGCELVEARKRYEAGDGALVACAGCYPTATSLAAAPAVRAGLVAEGTPVVVDAISGVTGAGKKCTPRTHFCFADENLEAYGVGSHRHTPEIEQILGLPGRVVFTPHLAPANRGLLSTVTMVLAPDAPRSTSEVLDLYRSAYEGSPFVTVLPEGQLPKTSSVVGTNCAHVSAVVDERTGVLVAIGAIDNLGKGAADQAVQCANILCGLPQDAGLCRIAVPVL